MSNTIRVISIDCETTSLSHLTGYAWAIGFAWTDYPLNFIAGTVYKEPICTDLIEIPIPKAWWNSETWKFCYQHNKERLSQLMIKANELHCNSYEALELRMQDNYTWRLKQIVENLIRGLEKDEYIVVFNHPDFDMPFLQILWPSIKEKGFYYRNIKDMQSLLEGHLGRQGTKEYLDARKKNFGEVKHSAKEDAEDQLKLLITSGAIKR